MIFQPQYLASRFLGNLSRVWAREGKSGRSLNDGKWWVQLLCWSQSSSALSSLMHNLCNQHDWIFKTRLWWSSRSISGGWEKDLLWISKPALYGDHHDMIIVINIISIKRMIVMLTLDWRASTEQGCLSPPCSPALDTSILAPQECQDTFQIFDLRKIEMLMMMMMGEEKIQNSRHLIPQYLH